jgi:hypothetical protein
MRIAELIMTLTANHLGLALNNPLIAPASSLNSRLDNIRRGP